MQPEGFDDALGASYRLLDRLGEGASGEVWRAVHKRTEETVATKLLRREHLADRDLVGRFIQERAVLTGLRHPAIVAVRDLVVEGERLAIVMEYVDGGSLRDVLQARGTLPPALAVEVAASVLDGLATAHERDVVHRDVKPDNVLLSRDWESAELDAAGASGTVKLVDFGIARIITDRQRSTTGLLGTPEYMSPELLTRGHAESPADVYGVGIMLYELLAGRTPFAGPGNEYTIAHRHVTATPPPLEVPDRLAAQLGALLEKDPTRRPGAAAAAVSLRALLPSLAGVAALTPQQGPEDFDTARGAATVVRGLAPTPVEPAAADEDEPVGEVDLGTPGQQTVVRPMQRRPVEEDRPAPAAPARRASTPGWKDPKLIAVVAAALVVLVGAVLFVTLRGGDAAEEEGPAEEPAAPVAAGPAEATLADPELPSGLTVSRQATFDPDTSQVDLTLTYSAEDAPLSGEILEVLPNPDGTCPTTVQWQGASQEQNLVTSTNIEVACGWALDVGTIQPDQTAVLEAVLEVPLEVDDSGSADVALDEWLAQVSSETTGALTDPDVPPTVTSYPVQRLQGVTVTVPSSTPAGPVVPVSLLAEWPSGADEVTPIYESGSSGEPTSVISAVAGGYEGVRFISGCSGALKISGLVVVAQYIEDGCTVEAEVGSFDAVSQEFDIVTRGS